MKERHTELRKNKNKGEVPSFRTEDEERAFWSKHDSSDHVDWTKASRRTMPKLRPSLQTISIRLPVPMIEEIKTQANRRDVPYQSLMKVVLGDWLKKELSKK